MATIVLGLEEGHQNTSVNVLFTDFVATVVVKKSLGFLRTIKND